MMMTLKRTFVGGVAALVFASGSFAEPTYDEIWSTCAAGREISPGITLGDTTYGVVFSAWLKDDRSGCPSWFPVWRGGGGSLVATIQRQGDAGFGNLVDITGGFFKLTLKDGTQAKACVESGTVEWPANRYVDDGCGKGVALVDAVLSWGCTGDMLGGFEGCLDDKDWLGPRTRLFRLPPKIWGALWSEPK